MVSMSRIAPRGLSSALGLAVALTVLGVSPATAQDESLCDLVDLDALNALGAPRYAEPLFGGPGSCMLEATPDQQGPHSVLLWLADMPFGATFDEMRAALKEQSPTNQDVVVGGYPALIDEQGSDGASVFVGLGERALTATTSVAESAEAGGMDERAYALAVAELVVEALGVTPDTGQAAPVIAAPAVDGIAWRTTRSAAGTEVRDVIGGVEPEMWDRLLAAGGAGFEQAGLLDAIALDAATDERIGTLLALRVSDAHATTLAPALLEWLAGLDAGGDMEFTDGSVGGRDVTGVVSGGEVRGYVYAAADTIYLVSMPEEHAAKVLAQLP